MSEDSPVFRYSGQLLDASRDSSVELAGLLSGDATPVPGLSQSFVPHFPVGVTGAALPVPSTGSDKHQIIDKNESLLHEENTATTDPLSRLWSRKTDSLGLDIDLDLDLTQPLVSPQDILSSGTGSELRIGADPFFS